MSKLIQGKFTALFLIALLATLIYSNTFSASFHFDDLQNIIENSKIKHLENLWDFSGSRYVGFLTFALNYYFGGLGVFGYHLVNLLIHITNGFLVYVLVLLLFEAVHLPRNRLIALATALLFIAHPIQTQAVTYIVQRFASLAALFYLLGVVGYLKWRLGKKFVWYVVALISVILGMKTKEIVITLPLMIVMVEVLFFEGKRRAALIPFLLTLLIIPLSRFEVLGEADQLVSETTLISRADYLFTQFRVIMTYLRLLVLPVGQNLDYDYPIYRSLFVPSVFFSFLFLSSLFALAVHLLRRSKRQPSTCNPQRKLIAFGIFWFFLTLTTESSLIPIRDVIFEHRVYLPSVGVFLSVCVAWGFVVSSRRRLVGLLAMGGIFLIFSAATYRRNLVWQNELTLWGDVMKKAPNRARGYNNLGLAYHERGRFEEEIREYQTALQLQPDYAKAHNNLGNAYVRQKRSEEAIQEYQIALQLEPDDAMAHANLGHVYGVQGRLDEAIREYQTALWLQPDLVSAHINLGIAYSNQGRTEEAIQEYQIALWLRPDNADGHNGLGFVYKNQGRSEEAIREYQIALRLQPDLAAAHNNLGVIYQENMERLDEAIQEFQTAIQLQPEYAVAHNSLGAAYYNQGRLEEAIREYQAALQLNPDYAMAHANLGHVYGAQGRLDEAIREYQTAIRLRPNQAEVHYNLANAYKGLGRMEEAAREYQAFDALKNPPPHE